MAAETATDLGYFFDTDEHAVSATFTPDGGSAETVTAIVSVQEVPAGVDSVEINVRTRTARVQASEFSTTPAAGDTLQISSTTYTIVSAALDASGDVYILDLGEG